MTFNIKDYDEEDQARMEEFGKWKTCSKCGVSKPRSWTEFHRAKAYLEGVRPVCKTCRSEKASKYYVENKEEIDRRNKRYKEDNPETVRESRKAHYLANKERASEWSRGYYVENRDRILERNKEYIQNNPEVRRRAKRKYRQQVEALPHTLTKRQWEDTLKHFDTSCSYCGAPESELGHTIHQEHLVPVSMGGGFVKGNIIPSCGACNASKHAEEFETWFRRQPFFEETQFKKIKEWQKDSE